MSLFPPVPSYDTLHPIAVHFPIGVLLTAPILTLAAAVWKTQARAMLAAGTLLTLVGLAAAFLAVSTGEAAEELAEHVPGAGATLERHERLAEAARNAYCGVAALMVIATVLFWRLHARVNAPLRLGAGLSLLLAQFGAGYVLIWAAHEGGKLVHTHGVRALPRLIDAVELEQSSAPPPVPPRLGSVDRLIPPAISDTQPRAYPGLDNVVAYGPDLYSGAAPAGEAAFDSLVALGVRTIISVDGAEPDVEAARLRGLRYVHLPIGYQGFDETRKLELARATRDLPRPIYMHCHHGRHRSAGAAATVAVCLGWMSPAQGVARMAVSGTAARYRGLFACVQNAVPLPAHVLDAAPASFPERVRPAGLVRAMNEIELAAERLKRAQREGWSDSAAGSQGSAAADAGLLADALRLLLDDERVAAKSEEFRKAVQVSADNAQRFEDLLLSEQRDAAAVEAAFERVMQDCTDCHTRHRD